MEESVTVEYKFYYGFSTRKLIANCQELQDCIRHSSLHFAQQQLN